MLNKSKLWLLSSLLIFVQSGNRMMTKAEQQNSAAPEAGVARELARARATNISGLRYRLNLELKPGAARLQGEEEIELQLARAGEPVVLDFRDLDKQGNVIEGAVSDVAVNEQAVNDLQQANGHLVLPARYFKAGRNTIKLAFTAGVASANRPLIRYVDREDGGEYVYTLLVPMDASLAFPCFDQPDLKGRFTLAVTAPESWTVIGNAESENVVAARAGLRRTQFRETQPLSTYLFAFAAGPFKQLAGASAGTPLRLFVRQSKLARAQEEWPEVIKLTRDGLKHYEEFFAQPFPFSKYDQVLLPGFAYGGMEHAGATFLREDSILFRTVPTKSDKLNRASLLLHELAHQWFGDLVTMRWFDDLWLKEGFAQYMAAQAMAVIYEPNEIWQRFYQTHKPFAYGIDETKGTTPIYQEVRNLKDAKSAYGAIVYEKAPSLLRALSFLIGEDKFRDGVRLFLKEHAYANAEWNDLIKAFERAAQQSLQRWAEAWVRRRGMPQVEIDWSCDARGVLDRFEIKQRDVLNEGGMWPVKTQLLLAYDDAAPQLITAQFDGAHATIKEALGKKCPAYVFGNEQDYGYGRFLLDAQSRQAVSARVAQINEPFLRTMLWGALWEAVREAELSPGEYLALVLKALPREQDEELAQSLLSRAATAYQRYLSQVQQTSIAPQFEAAIFERMQKAEEQGLRIVAFRALRTIASTTAARAQLKEILSGKIVIPGVEIKPLDRWRIVTALVAVRDADAEALLKAERQRDQSDDGRKQAYVAAAARADAATKRRYFNDYLRNKNVPEDWVEASLGAFNAWNQSTLTLFYLQPALAALPQVKRERKIFFVLAWLNAFIGGQQSKEALQQVQEFLQANKLERDLELKVLEIMDELERTVRIRARH